MLNQKPFARIVHDLHHYPRMNSLAQRPLARFVILAAVGLVVAAVSSASLEAAGWNQFRGPNGQGVSDDAQPPLTFGPNTNLLWKADLGTGHSSPVIWAKRIFVTASHNQELETLCLDRQSGRELWRKSASLGVRGVARADKCRSIPPSRSPG